MGTSTPVRRRSLLEGTVALSAAAAVGGVSRDALAFGEEGAFHPRVMLTGAAKWEGVRASAPARWSEELARRTSAPARLRPVTVRADAPDLLAEPFIIWSGGGDPYALTPREVANLRRFVQLGGIIFVDDFDPATSAFTQRAKREIARVLPDQTPIAIGPENVVFRSFYLLRRAAGRVAGPPKLEAIVRGGAAQVIFSKHDVLGALATGAGGTPAMSIEGAGEGQREEAIRLAVNVAMYVLCSNYKDDQVHAEHLMRRRGTGR
jgi:hypothetical protein